MKWFAALLLLTGPALADTTVVTDVTWSSPTLAPIHQVYTARYRDGKVRVESDHGEVILYNLRNRTATWLHPAQHTYVVVPFGKLPAAHTTLQERLGPQQASTADVQVKPLGETTMLGRAAHQVSLKGHAQISIDTHNGNGGVGFPGGGAAGGGQAGGGFNNGPVPPMNGGLGSIPVGGPCAPPDEDDPDTPSLDIDGQETVGDPPGDLTASDMMPWYMMALPMNRLTVLLTQPLATKVPGFPLAGKVSLHTHWTAKSPESRVPEDEDLDVTTQVVSINQDPVSNTLLYPPDGWHEEGASDLIH
ncbi:MAG TPA: hypothetical protein VGO93_08500 [Candidatus Xenobia bacterium]|jgi:hypothetical protein